MAFTWGQVLCAHCPPYSQSKGCCVKNMCARACCKGDAHVNSKVISARLSDKERGIKERCHNCFHFRWCHFEKSSWVTFHCSGGWGHCERALLVPIVTTKHVLPADGKLPYELVEEKEFGLLVPSVTGMACGNSHSPSDIPWSAVSRGLVMVFPRKNDTAFLAIWLVVVLSPMWLLLVDMGRCEDGCVLKQQLWGRAAWWLFHVLAEACVIWWLHVQCDSSSGHTGFCLTADIWCSSCCSLWAVQV